MLLICTLSPPAEQSTTSADTHIVVAGSFLQSAYLFVLPSSERCVRDRGCDGLGSVVLVVEAVAASYYWVI